MSIDDRAYTSTEDDWEICLLTCDKGHQRKLAIHKESSFRDTYCLMCGKPMKLRRVKDDTRTKVLC